MGEARGGVPLSAWRTPHAALVALALVALVLLPAFFLASEPGSALAGRVARFEAGASPRFEVAGVDASFFFGDVPALDPSRDALLVVAPRVGYSDAEVLALASFVERGGRLLVADDGGVARDLLARLGLGVESTTSAVYSPGFATDPARLVTLSTGVVPGLAAEVVLTRPVVVRGGDPVLLSPDLAWLDLNDDGSPDVGEPLAPAVLAARTRAGAGELLVVGDPDAVSADAPGSARALVDWLVAGERRLVVDEGHRVASDPLGLNALLAGAQGPVVGTGILILTLALGAFVVLGPRLVRGERKRKRAPLAARHPSALVAEVLGELKRE